MTKLLQQCFLFSIVVVIPGHNLGNSQVSVNRTIGPTLVIKEYYQLKVLHKAKCVIMSFEHMYTKLFNHYIRGQGNSVPPNVSVNI